MACRFDSPCFCSLILLLTFFVTFGIGAWFSALNVKYRDVRYVVPIYHAARDVCYTVAFLWVMSFLKDGGSVLFKSTRRM